MANNNGWWSLTTNINPNQNDLEHIAELIRKGFTSGEIIREDITCSYCGLPLCEDGSCPDIDCTHNNCY